MNPRDKGTGKRPDRQASGVSIKLRRDVKPTCTKNPREPQTGFHVTFFFSLHEKKKLNQKEKCWPQADLIDLVLLTVDLKSYKKTFRFMHDFSYFYYAQPGGWAKKDCLKGLILDLSVHGYGYFIIGQPGVCGGFLVNKC